ncbi:MAG: hypothetical protein M3Y04_04465, partial [Actinomycetota bacterium]|nr:hypothetical protein [Actinomycetota bacterium]
AEAPLRQLEALEARLRELRALVDVLGEARSALDSALGKAQNQVDELGVAIARHAARLEEMAARLGVLRRRDLLSVVTASEAEEFEAEGQADESIPTEDVAFAGWLAERIGGPVPSGEDHARAVAAVDRAQRPLVDELRHGYAASIAHDDDVMTVEVTSDTGTFGLSVLADRLRRQETHLRTLLTEGDREVFEKFLLNRVAHELRRLLGDADGFVADVNAALARTRTASGLQVELAWELASDDGGVREALRLLRHDTTQMGDDDRAALRAFFDGAIRQQRAERPEVGYKEALEAALDYRAWHVFQPHLRTAEGTRARLTRARFRELSGGEQAVALHLPLFAAAAAHYDRAGADAPRLVALDEAFAGIDETMRGELMALTVAFDLDVILTGHELWGAYAEVPAIAVHDLLRRPPAEGVSVFSLRWDGANLVEEEDEDPEDGDGSAAPGEGDGAGEHGS